MENYSNTRPSQRINRTNAVAFVGLVVHRETIAVVVRYMLSATLMVEDRGIYPNRQVRTAKLTEALCDYS